VTPSRRRRRRDPDRADGVRNDLTDRGAGGQDFVRQRGDGAILRPVPPAIACTGLSKSYGPRQAVQSLDLEVEPGTLLGFLGPNGAGKTSVIRILTTILTPDAGAFTVAGVPHDRPAEIRRRVGVLPESAGYAEGQTGEQVLTFFARLYGQSGTQASATARELLDLVGLAERAHTLVAGYSRGMRQRLGIARALVNRPEVVFLDEPTLGLDPAGQRHVLQVIGGIARQRGSTVVLSTHLLAEVEEVCDRVVILNAGRVVADGGIDEVARVAAAPRQGRVRLPADSMAAGLRVLSASPEVAGIARSEAGDEIVVELREGLTPAEAGPRILRALLDADLPVLAVELDRGRLSDAFLTLTADT
jgi:ABC-2 type transport system ATP-binding protein